MLHEHEQPLPPPVVASLRSRSAAFGARGGGGHAGRGAAAVGGWAQSARKYKFKIKNLFT